MGDIYKTSDDLTPIPEDRIAQLRALKDEDIDYSDIPELDEDFFRKAKLVRVAPHKLQLSLELDSDIIAWFKSQGQDYQMLINNALRTYIGADTQD